MTIAEQTNLKDFLLETYQDHKEDIENYEKINNQESMLEIQWLKGRNSLIKNILLKYYQIEII